MQIYQVVKVFAYLSDDSREGWSEQLLNVGGPGAVPVVSLQVVDPLRVEKVTKKKTPLLLLFVQKKNEELSLDFLHWWRSSECPRRSQSQTAGRWASGCRGWTAYRWEESEGPPSLWPHCAGSQTHCWGEDAEESVYNEAENYKQKNRQWKHHQIREEKSFRVIHLQL